MLIIISVFTEIFIKFLFLLKFLCSKDRDLLGMLISNLRKITDGEIADLT